MATEWASGYKAGTRWIPGLVARGLIDADLTGYIDQAVRWAGGTARDDGFMAGHAALLVGVDLSFLEGQDL